MKGKNFCFLGHYIYYKSNKKVKVKYCFEDIEFSVFGGSLTIFPDSLNISLNKNSVKHRRFLRTLYYFDPKSAEKFVKDYPFVTINGIIYKTISQPKNRVVIVEVV
jgi:hypothetical protein